MKYHPEIDGIRAIAVLPVIFFHAGFAVFPGGFVGVDIFFVISGYLITSIILSDIDKGEFSLLNFYERRARRILPALFFIVILCMPTAVYLFSPTDLKDFMRSVVSISLFSSNILFWSESGYFDGPAELKPLLHTWSLAVEEQYYILFPIFLLVATRFKKRITFLVLVVMALVSLGLSQWGAYKSPVANFYLLPTRGWELLIGSLLSFTVNVRGPITLKKPSNQVLSLIGLLLVSLSFFFFDENTLAPGVLSLLPTVGTVLLIVFSRDGTLANHILSSRPMVHIGLISYSAYLWHFPIFAFMRYRFKEELFNSLSGILILLVLVLAHLSWRYVEQPFRQKHRYSRNFIFKFSGVSAAALIGLGGYGAVGGYDRTYDVGLIAQIDPQPYYELSGTCFLVKNDSFEVDTCLGKYGTRSADYLLIGDSHAASLFPGLRIALEERGVSLHMMTYGNCVPLIDHNKTLSYDMSRADIRAHVTERCEKLKKQVNHVLDTYSFDRIMVLTNFTNWMLPARVTPSYKTDFLEVVASLREQSHVTVLGILPVWKPSLPKVLRLELNEKRRIQKISKNGVYPVVFEADEYLKEKVHEADAEYISILDMQCFNKSCQRIVEVDASLKALAYDDAHLTYDGSKYIAEHLVDRIVN